MMTVFSRRSGLLTGLLALGLPTLGWGEVVPTGSELHGNSYMPPGQSAPAMPAATAAGARTAVPPGHFKCYKARDLKNPKFLATTLRLNDQFGVNDGQFEVKKPYVVCSPADKNGEGMNNPADHLTCYKIKGPKLDKSDRPQVEATDQFGPLQLEVKKPFLLCVPSALTIPCIANPCGNGCGYVHECGGIPPESCPAECVPLCECPSRWGITQEGSCELCGDE